MTIAHSKDLESVLAALPRPLELAVEHLKQRDMRSRCIDAQFEFAPR